MSEYVLRARLTSPQNLSRLWNSICGPPVEKPPLLFLCSLLTTKSTVPGVYCRNLLTMSQFVTEADIDHHEVIRRGGANCGDEDFAFVQCPVCGHVYLIESEVDTAFLDASDLSRRVGFYSEGDIVPCINCGKPLLAEQIWAALRGDEGSIAWQVSWETFRASGWAWAAKGFDASMALTTQEEVVRFSTMRLAQECAKLDPGEEQTLAEERFVGEADRQPPY